MSTSEKSPIQPMKPVQACAIPTQCALAEYAQSADFADAYQTANPQPMRSALAIWLDTVVKTPAWIDRSMALRNAVVKRFGLKDLGRLSQAAPLKTENQYQVGDRLGIFTIESLGHDELVLCDQDKHLDVRLSIYKQHGGSTVVVTTAVKTHNFLGRLYMLPVKPMHKLIVPAMLSRISQV